MEKKTLKFILKFFVSLVFLFWVVFKVDWGEVRSILAEIEIRHIAIYFLFYTAGLVVSAYKWKILANFKGVSGNFQDFFKLYLSGTFVNNFMPSFIGGDAYRIYQSGKSEKKYSQAASAVVMDRMTGLWGAMLMALIFSLVNYPLILREESLLVLDVFMIVFLLGVVFFNRIRMGIFGKKIGKSYVFKKIVPEKALVFMRELDGFLGNRKILIKSLLGAFIFGFFGIALANYSLFLAFGEKIDLRNYLAVIFLISFVSSLPISINNVGVKEWAYVTFFGLFGVSSSLVVAVAITSRILQMLFSFLALPVYLRSKGVLGSENE